MALETALGIRAGIVNGTRAIYWKSRDISQWFQILLVIRGEKGDKGYKSNQK